MKFLNDFGKTKTKKNLSIEVEEQITQTFEAQEPIKVIICGEVNAGKSSFINTMLGDVILPASIAGHTAAIHYCKHGPMPKFHVDYRDDRSRHSAPLTKDELRKFLNDAGADVKLIEVEHPSIPAGLVVIDSPGVNDTDPYRDQLVKTFLALADVMVLVVDITRAVTIEECKLVNAFVGISRLDHCIFVGNKIDTQDPSTYENLKASFISTLQKSISPNIKESQVALMTTDTKKDGGESAASVAQMIKHTMHWRETVMKDRALRQHLTKLLNEREILIGKSAQRKDVTSQYEGWKFRANQLIENHSRLSDGRRETISTFEKTLQKDFDQVQDHLSHALSLSPDPKYLQQIAEEKVSASIESANIKLANSLLKNPQLNTAIPSLESAVIAVHESIDNSAQSGSEGVSAGNIALTLAATGVLSVIGLPHLAAAAVAAWGIWKSNSGQADHHKNIEQSRNEFLSECQDKLNGIKSALVENLNEWFDKEIIEQNQRIERFLRDLFCVLDDGTTGSIEEINSALKEREHQINQIKNELGTAA